MRWTRVMVYLLGGMMLLACNLSPDLFSPQEEIRGMGEIRVTAATTAKQGPVTVSVTPDGSGDYPSLEAAVEEVPEGSTIILEAGTFLLTEPLSVTKALTLVGAGSDQTEVVSGAEDHVVHFSGDGPFTAQGITFRHQGNRAANVVVVDGGEIDFNLCRFTGGIRDEEEKLVGSGLLIRERTNGRVRECRMEGNGLHGVAVRDQAQPTLEGNTCTGNGENGIAYFGDAGGTAQGNECSDNGMHGISINEQAEPTLERNVCRENEQAGIRFSDSSGGVASQNDCSDNKLSGIIVRNNAHPALEGNNCKGNQEGGIIYFHNSGGVARENECSGNKWGIYIEETANPELVDNDCRDNSEADVEDRRVAARPTTELTVTAVVDDTPVAPTHTATPEPSFGPIVFSLEIVEGTNEPINPNSTFPAGVTTVYGTWDYQGMTDDIEWGWTWYVNDVDVLSGTRRWDEDLDWSGEPSGRYSDHIFYLSVKPLDSGNVEPIDSGNYELRLFIEGQLVQSGTFVIE